jgi:fatty acid desaturase
MAEETKQEEKKADLKKIASTIFKVILGVVFLALGVWAVIAWWRDLLLVVKGCIGAFLILAGVITLAIAKE